MYPKSVFVQSDLAAEIKLPTISQNKVTTFLIRSKARAISLPFYAPFCTSDINHQQYATKEP